MTRPVCWPIDGHELQLKTITDKAELELWGRAAMKDRTRSSKDPQAYSEYIGALVDVYHQAPPHENLMFGLWHNDDIAGLFILSRASNPSVATVTCEITPRYRRHGYATAAMATLITRGSTEFGFQDFRAEINADNIASQKLAKHAGFMVMGMIGSELQFEYRVPDTKQQSFSTKPL